MCSPYLRVSIVALFRLYSASCTSSFPLPTPLLDTILVSNPAPAAPSLIIFLSSLHLHNTRVDILDTLSYGQYALRFRPSFFNSDLSCIPSATSFNFHPFAVANVSRTPLQALIHSGFRSHPPARPRSFRCHSRFGSSIVTSLYGMGTVPGGGKRSREQRKGK
jgi:hypothetical protein